MSFRWWNRRWWKYYWNRVNNWRLLDNDWLQQLSGDETVEQGARSAIRRKTVDGESKVRRIARGRKVGRIVGEHFRHCCAIAQFVVMRSKCRANERAHSCCQSRQKLCKNFMYTRYFSTTQASFAVAYFDIIVAMYASIMLTSNVRYIPIYYTKKMYIWQASYYCHRGICRIICMSGK